MKLRRKPLRPHISWRLRADAKALLFFATAAKTARSCARDSVPTRAQNAVSRSSCNPAVKRVPLAAIACAQYDVPRCVERRVEDCRRMLFCSLSDSTFTRLYREEVDKAFSALDCMLNREKAIYAGAELTSGRRLYNAFREFHVKTADELKQVKGKDWYGANIWDANVNAARDFAAQVREKVAGKTLVITPAPFSAPGWTPPEY